jgi:hypothetical protein
VVCSGGTAALSTETAVAPELPDSSPVSADFSAVSTVMLQRYFTATHWTA